MNRLDQLITTFDLGLRTGFRQPTPPAALSRCRPVSGTFGEAERAKAAALMRVNHVGEVCAQALYAGQALTAKKTKPCAPKLEQAGARGDRSSCLVRNAHQRTWRPQEPVEPAVVRRRRSASAWWPGCSVTNGTSAFSPKPNPGRGAPRRPPAAVAGSRRQKPRGGRADEARRGPARADAVDHGGAPLPPPVKWAMRLAADLMRQTASRI